MSNEEFQNLVLDNFKNMNIRFDSIEKGQKEIKADIAELKDMVRNLESTNADNHLVLSKNIEELKESNKSIYEIIGKNEVDITTLKRKIV